MSDPAVTTPPATEPGKRTVRKLSAVQTGQLYGWLDEHRDMIGPDKATADEVSTLASEALKFDVPPSSIRNLCADMAIKLKGAGDRGSRQPAFDPAPLLKRLGDLESRVDAMADWSMKTQNRLAALDPKPAKKAG